MCVVGAASAAMVEDFSGYSDGEFVSQTGGAWSGSSDWQISTQAGNKVLVVAHPASDIALLYTGETFSSAGAGYTMMLTMYAQAGDAWASSYSGWVCDANGTTPTAAGHAYRVFPTGGTTFMAIGGGSITGSYSIAWSTPTYFRQYRQGDSVQVYVSSSAFSESNVGTLILDGTVPALSDGGNFLGLYGVGTVAFDDVAFYSGNVVPEPATLALLSLGGLWLRKRM
jgi:hypothetical protein